MKYCKKCDTEKPKTEFCKDKSKKYGLKSNCRSCASGSYLSWCAENPEKRAASRAAWRLANPDMEAASAALYRERNAERIADLNREWHKANSEKVAERHRAWYEKNAESSIARIRLWRSINPEKLSAQVRNRRAMKRNADGSHTADDVMSILQSQRFICANCPEKLIKSGKNNYHVDHIQPLSKGGSNDKYNLQCLCPECNLRKHAKDPYEWAKQNWRLL